MANRNRNEGHNWEREIVRRINTFEHIFPPVGTSRELSRDFDDNKIDIVTRKILQMEKFGLVIQAKSSTVTQQYPKLLNEVKTGMEVVGLEKTVPVVFHKQTEKSGTKFMHRDDFACLFLDDFMEIYTEYRKYKKGFELLDNNIAPASIPQDIHQELNKLDL